MIIIKAGDKFGKLTAISFSYKDKKSKQHWLFKCSCGNEKIIMVNNVKSKMTKSCGCLRGSLRKTHGMSRTKTNKSWRDMKDRCLNPNSPKYKNYGDRGIIICDEWLGKNGFINFYKDMGEKPEGLTIDRINNDGNYCKKNCRWATQKEQQNNRRNNLK